MRKLLLSGVIVLVLGTVSAVASPPASPRAVQAFAATRSVKVGDNYFIRKGSKPTITVTRGSTVVWRFRGHSLHNVTVKRGPLKFHSGNKDSGRFRKKLTRRGTYKIVCTIHAPDMAMTIRVQ